MTNSTLRTFAAAAVASVVTLGLAGCMGLPLPQAPAEEDPVVDVIESTVPADEPADVAIDQAIALETYVGLVQESIPQLEEQFADSFSDIQILAVQPDTLEYVYYFLNPVDAAATVANLEASMDDTLRPYVETAILPEMIDFGITVDPKVRYTYYNSDGSLIWTYTFEAS